MNIKQTIKVLKNYTKCQDVKFNCDDCFMKDMESCTEIFNNAIRDSAKIIKDFDKILNCEVQCDSCILLNKYID